MSQYSTNPSERLIIRPHAGPAGDVLVTVLLRGGMDALYTIPPLGDRDYATQRAEFDASASGRRRPANLDDFFGLHADFEPLLELYRRGLMAIVHACGPTEPLMSHFDAMRLLEHGAAATGQTDGWLGRHLQAQTSRSASPFRAVALSATVPLILRGVAGARALDSLDDMRLEVPLDWQPGFMTALKRVYAKAPDPLAVAGRSALSTLAEVERLSSQLVAKEPPTPYLPTAMMQQFRLVARLIKAKVGLEAAVLASGGWDTHLTQTRSIERPMLTLAGGLRTFVDALGDDIQRVTIVVVSEFGRRVAPNGAGGTDHGRASAALVIGGNIRGGKVYARWPGMGAHALDSDGNLAVTTDFRDVLAEVLDRRLGNSDLDRIFPGYSPKYLGFTAG